MTPTVTADDLWPLVQKLPHEEQLRLAKLALAAAAKTGASDGDAYRAAPPAAEEFSQVDEALAWESEGWEQFDGAG